MNTPDSLSKMNLDTSTGEIEYSLLLEKIDFDVDADYLSFIRRYNGAHGSINNAYLHLWKIDELISQNPYYDESVDDGYSSGLFFIGSDGGSIGYSIRKKDGVFIEIAFPDIGTDIPEKECGRNFNEFITYISSI